MKNNQPKPYKILENDTKYIFRGMGTNPETGVENFRQEVVERPLEEIENQIMSSTDGLIGIFDGSITSGKQFLDDSHERRFDGPVVHTVYLDKSARPVRALVDGMWPYLSEAQKPTSSFLNIDKIDYLLLMGYSLREIHDGKYFETRDVTLDKVQDQDYLKRHVARIRALYLDIDKSKLPDIERLLDDVDNGTESIDELDKLWDIPTRLDNQHVAIVDEVKSSGATLRIADQLLQYAIPEARWEPVFWSTPYSKIYNKVNPETDEIDSYIADTERPPWYRQGSSDGRLVENKDEALSSSSKYIKQRIGKLVLSVPYRLKTKRTDHDGMAFRADFRQLIQRLRGGELKFRPNIDRSDADYDDKLNAFSRVS